MRNFLIRISFRSLPSLSRLQLGEFCYSPRIQIWNLITNAAVLESELRKGLEGSSRFIWYQSSCASCFTTNRSGKPAQHTLDGFEICVEPPLPPPVSPHSDKSHSGVGQTQCVRIATCRQELYAVYRHCSMLEACPHTWGWLEISLIIDLSGASSAQMFIFGLHKLSVKYGHCCVHVNPRCFWFFFICRWAKVDWWLMRCIGVTGK